MPLQALLDTTTFRPDGTARNTRRTSIDLKALATHQSSVNNTATHSTLEVQSGKRVSARWQRSAHTHGRG